MDAQKHAHAAMQVAYLNTLDNLRSGVWSASAVREDIQDPQTSATWPMISGMALALAIYQAE